MRLNSTAVLDKQHLPTGVLMIRAFAVCGSGPGLSLWEDWGMLIRVEWPRECRGGAVARVR